MRDKEMTVDPIGTHTSHCCAKHGCKYGGTIRATGEKCPVEAGTHAQKYPCEWCRHPVELKAEIASLQEDLEWSQKMWGDRPYYG